MSPWLLAPLLALAAAPDPGTPVDPVGRDAGVAVGLLDQATLPALAERRMAADARARAAERYFAGESALDAAFPDLAGAPIGDPGFLAGLRARIADAGVARAAERVVAPDPRLPPREAAAWAAELRRTCDAEDLADQRLTRLVDGLAAGLAAAPSLTDAALAGARAGWAEALGRAVGADPSTEAGADVLGAAVAAGEAEARLAQLRSLAWRALTVPGDRSLADAAAAELEAWSHPDGAPQGLLAVDPREIRLRAVAPVVPGEVGERVRAALDARERERLTASMSAIAAAPSPPLPTGAAALAAAVSDAEARVAAITAERDALGPVPADAPADDLPALRREEVDARLGAASQALAEASAALTARQQLDAAGLAGSGASADEAQRRADEARREAEKQAGTLERRLREQIATMREREATAVRADQDRQQASAAAFQDLSRRVAAQQDALAAALSLPPLAKERQSAFDSAYRSGWELVDAIRAAEATATEELSKTDAENAAMLSDLGAGAAPTGGGSAQLTLVLTSQGRTSVSITTALDERREPWPDCA